MKSDKELLNFVLEQIETLKNYTTDQTEESFSNNGQ